MKIKNKSHDFKPYSNDIKVMTGGSTHGFPKDLLRKEPYNCKPYVKDVDVTATA